MSQYTNDNTGSGATVVQTLTGNSGGAVPPTGGNINVLGAGALAFAGNPGTSTLTGSITPGTALIATITGDTGGALSPTAGNFNIIGGPGVTTTGSGSTLTINSVVFRDQGASTSSNADSGEFVTAGITLTTPASPAQGEEIIYVCTTAAALVIDAASTHLIRIGSQVTSAGGTMTSNAIGDSVTLRYRTADTTWYATSVIGNWTPA